MISSTYKRGVGAAIGAGVFAGSLLLGVAPSAQALPPNCTAADLAGVASGVSAATSAYLFTHPPSTISSPVWRDRLATPSGRQCSSISLTTRRFKQNSRVSGSPWWI